MRRETRRLLSPSGRRGLFPGGDRVNALEIHLQSGFQRDTVLIWADGDEVGEILAALTHPASGLAGVLREAHAQRRARLQIVIPNRRLRHEIALPAGTPYVGVSVHGNRIRVHLSRQAFRYPDPARTQPYGLESVRRAIIRCPRRILMHEIPGR